MAYRKTTSFSKILIAVFGIAFGLAALAMAYQAVLNSTESRSKAAVVEKIHQSWSVADGNIKQWKTNKNFSVTSSDWIVKNNKPPVKIMNQEFNLVVMPKGNKFFAMNLRLNNIAQSEGGGGGGVQPHTRLIAGKLTYWVSQPSGGGTGRVKKETTVSVNIPEGLNSTFQVAFPEIDQIMVNGLVLDITEGLKNGDVLYIQRLKLASTYMTTPTPPACGQLVTIEYVKEYACSSGFALGANFTCSGGYKSGFGGTTCRDKSDINFEASQRCKNYDQCGGGSTGASGPTGTPPLPPPPPPQPQTPTPTVSPTPGS